GQSVVADQWNHVAVTIDSSSAALYVASEAGPYQLLDSITGEDFAGDAGEVMIEEPLGWSLGRGMSSNGAADWADALIDEVRISDVALSPDEFLFAAVPEPATWTMAIAALVFAGTRRRRRVSEHC